MGIAIVIYLILLGSLPVFGAQEPFGCGSAKKIVCGEIQVKLDLEPAHSDTTQLGYKLLRSYSRSSRYIVVVHGGPGDSFDYLVETPEEQSVLERLRERFNIILYDQRGSRRSILKSGKRELGPDLLTLENHAHDLEEIRKQVANGQKISIIGHSHGGLIALVYAKLYPNSVSELILYSSSPDYEYLINNQISDQGQDFQFLGIYLKREANSHDQINAILGDYKTLESLVYREELKRDRVNQNTTSIKQPVFTVEDLRQHVRMNLLASSDTSQTKLRGFLQDFISHFSERYQDRAKAKESAPALINAKVRDIMNCSLGMKPAIRDKPSYYENWKIGAFCKDISFKGASALNELSMLRSKRILIISGQRDTVVPPNMQERLKALFPEARLVKFENSFHQAMRNEPDRFLKALLEFLD